MVNGSIEVGSDRIIHSGREGYSSLKFDRFNAKMQTHRDKVFAALSDASARFQTLALAYGRAITVADALPPIRGEAGCHGGFSGEPNPSHRCLARNRRRRRLRGHALLIGAWFDKRTFLTDGQADIGYRFTAVLPMLQGYASSENFLTRINEAIGKTL